MYLPIPDPAFYAVLDAFLIQVSVLNNPTPIAIFISYTLASKFKRNIPTVKQIMLVSRSPPSFSLQTVAILPLTPTENSLQQTQCLSPPSHLPETLMRDCEEVCQCDNNYRNYTIQQLQKDPLFDIWKDTHATPLSHSILTSHTSPN